MGEKADFDFPLLCSLVKSNNYEEVYATLLLHLFTKEDILNALPLEFHNLVQETIFNFLHYSGEFEKSKKTKKHGFTLLMLAAKNGFLPLTKLFIQLGCDFGTKNKGGKNALMIACGQGESKIVDFLCTCPAAGMHINDQDLGKNCAVLLACQSASNFFGHDVQIVKTLLRFRGLHVDARNLMGDSSLFTAVVYNKTEIVSILLDLEDINRNRQNKSLSSCLNYACECGFTKIVKKFLKYDDVLLNTQDVNGNTALANAIINRRMTIMNLLFEKPGLDLHCKNKNGKNVFDLASENASDVQLVKILKALQDYSETHGGKEENLIELPEKFPLKEYLDMITWGVPERAIRERLFKFGHNPRLYKTLVKVESEREVPEYINETTEFMNLQRHETELAEDEKEEN